MSMQHLGSTWALSQTWHRGGSQCLIAPCSVSESLKNEVPEPLEKEGRATISESLLCDKQFYLRTVCEPVRQILGEHLKVCVLARKDIQQKQ